MSPNIALPKMALVCIRDLEHFREKWPLDVRELVLCAPNTVNQCPYGQMDVCSNRSFLASFVKEKL